MHELMHVLIPMIVGILCLHIATRTTAQSNRNDREAEKQEPAV